MHSAWHSSDGLMKMRKKIKKIHIKKWKYAQTDDLKKQLRPFPVITNEGLIIKAYHPLTHKIEVIADFTVGHEIRAVRLKVGNLE